MTLKVGLIARSEERGLGIQTKAFYDNINPDRTLVVLPVGQASNEPFDQNPSWYPDAAHVKWVPGGAFPERAVRKWLDGLDVLFTAETFYDWRIVQWAAEAGVATVCQGNPEFYQHATNSRLPHPTVWWAPTTWRVEHFPADRTRVVGVPVDVRPRTAASPTVGGPLRIVHVVGRQAINDRNGTQSLIDVVAHSDARINLTVYIQDGAVKVPKQVSDKVHIYVERGSIPDRWSLYANHQLLVIPRRFGGLCLTAQEGMACGLGLVMTDVAPNNGFYPSVPIPMTRPGSFRTQCGEIPLHNPHPLMFKRLLGELAADRSRVTEAQHDAAGWASRHSWPNMLGQYHDELEQAVARIPKRRTLFTR